MYMYRCISVCTAPVTAPRVSRQPFSMWKGCMPSSRWRYTRQSEYGICSRDCVLVFQCCLRLRHFWNTVYLKLANYVWGLQVTIIHLHIAFKLACKLGLKLRWIKCKHTNACVIFASGFQVPPHTHPYPPILANTSSHTHTLSLPSRRHLRETLVLSNSTDLNKLTACALILLGQIFLSLGNTKVSPVDMLP